MPHFTIHIQELQTFCPDTQKMLQGPNQQLLNHPLLVLLLRHSSATGSSDSTRCVNTRQSVHLSLVLRLRLPRQLRLLLLLRFRRCEAQLGKGTVGRSHVTGPNRLLRGHSVEKMAPSYCRKLTEEEGAPPEEGHGLPGDGKGGACYSRYTRRAMHPYASASLLGYSSALPSFPFPQRFHLDAHAACEVAGALATCVGKVEIDNRN